MYPVRPQKSPSLSQSQQCLQVQLFNPRKIKTKKQITYFEHTMGLSIHCHSRDGEGQSVVRKTLNQSKAQTQPGLFGFLYVERPFPFTVSTRYCLCF